MVSEALKHLYTILSYCFLKKYTYVIFSRA